MKKFISSLKFAYTNFGPLIVFYGVNHFWGLKPAIAFTVLFTLVEVGAQWKRRLPFSMFFIFSTVMTLVFGAVDLISQDSWLFKYEPSLTNVVTGIFFGSSLFTSKSILEEFYTKSPKAIMPMPPLLRGYFRFLVAAWTCYFFVKAAVYFWMARRYTIEQGLWVRTLVGNVSLVLMIAGSMFGGRVWVRWKRGIVL